MRSIVHSVVRNFMSVLLHDAVVHSVVHDVGNDVRNSVPHILVHNGVSEVSHNVVHGTMMDVVENAYTQCCALCAHVVKMWYGIGKKKCFKC